MVARPFYRGDTERVLGVGGGVVKGGEEVVTTIADIVLVLRLNEHVRTNK